MAEDPAPDRDLPSDIAFRFFLLGLEPDVVVKDYAKTLRYPERSYYESIATRISMKNSGLVASEPIV